MFEGILNTPLYKNKARASCAKRTLDAVKLKSTWYVFWNISMILAMDALVEGVHDIG